MPRLQGLASDLTGEALRLNLYWRGRDVIDVEVHLWKKREDSDQPEPPKLEASSGGLQERAEPFGGPDTAVSFGFTP